MEIITINSLIQRLSLVSVIITLAIGGLLLYQNLHTPELSKKSSLPVSTAVWHQTTPDSLRFDGHLFVKQAGDQVDANVGPLAKRFRLAGTFFAASNYQHSRKAIIDDIQKNTQCMVAEGDLIDDDIIVVMIFRDRVVLRTGGNDEQLWLSYSDAGKQAAATLSSPSMQPDGLAETTLNRFGKRTGERRWVLERQEVVRYYQELLNNPDRLAKVFESLKPVYQAGKIAGYTLDIEGEGDVFRAFGLNQGDVIRKVNSMPMISQARAEYFINEFVKDRVNGFVLDLERDNKPEKLIYLIR